MENFAQKSNTPFYNAATGEDPENPGHLFQPISSSPATGLKPISSRRSVPSLHRLTSVRSQVDGHGYYIPPEEELQHKDEDDSTANKAFEVAWDGPDDPMNPKNRGVLRKWTIVVTLACGSLCVTCGSSLYTSIYPQMNKEFGSSRIEATLGLSLFVFGLGLSPMILGPLSEFYGRRPIYILAYIFFTIWLVPCAVATNIQTMLIARFFSGLSGSAFLSVAGGTVGDLFARHQLQGPMLLYSASPFFGPGIGPVIGGFINYNASWRWSFYVLLIWSGLTLVAVTLLVPETYSPVLLRRKAQIKRKETGDEQFKAPIETHQKSIFWTIVRSLYRPFLLLTLDPMCFNLCLFSAILLGILYLFFGTFDLVFTNVYGFNQWQVGLTFFGLLTGMIVALLSDPIWHFNYLRLLRNHNDTTHTHDSAGSSTSTSQPEKEDIDYTIMHSEPEFRLPPAIIGGWLSTFGLFIFAWTIYPSIHWLVPLIGAALFGCGMILVFSGVFTFLVEAFPLFAASALSANAFARSTFAGAFPLFGVQMYEKLGYHWATTLLAVLTLLCAPFPYLFFVYGKKLRGRSRFGSVL